MSLQAFLTELEPLVLSGQHAATDALLARLEGIKVAGEEASVVGRVYLLAGLHYVGSTRLGLGITAFRNSVRLLPTDQHALYYLGIFLPIAGKSFFVEARDVLMRLLELYPDFGALVPLPVYERSLASLAVCCGFVGPKAEAVRYLEELAALTGKAEYYHLLAEMLLSVERRSEAEDAMRKALAIEPGLSFYLGSLGAEPWSEGAGRGTEPALEDDRCNLDHSAQLVACLLRLKEMSKGPAERLTRIVTARLHGVSDLLKQEGCALLHLEAGEDLSGPAPTVESSEGRAPQAEALRARDVYVARLRDVDVLGGTRYLFSRREPTAHSDEDALYYADRLIEPKTPCLHRARARELAFEMSRDTGAQIERAIHLMGEQDRNYYHFVCEVLPRLALVDSLSELEGLPLLVSDGLHPNMQQALQLMNTRGRELITIKDATQHHCNELVYPSDVSQVLNIYGRRASEDELYLSRKWVGQVRQGILERLVPHPKRPHKRLYIRRGSRHRGLVNEPELEQKLSRLGYQVCNLDKMSFSDQVRLFAKASHIVAPTGAALTNLLWCQPGVKAAVLLSDHPLLQLGLWKQLARVSGVEVAYVHGPRRHKVVGKDAVHDDYEVSFEALRAVL